MQQLSAGHDQDQQPGRASIRLARPNNTNPSSGSNGENNMTSSSQVEKTRNRKPCVPGGASTRSRTQGAARMQPRLMFFPAGKNATHLTCARAISNQKRRINHAKSPSSRLGNTPQEPVLGQRPAEIPAGTHGSSCKSLILNDKFSQGG